MQTSKKELSRYLVAGFSAVGTDSLVYWALLHFLTPSPSKAISFICGTIVAYLINKYWTFEISERSYREMSKFAALYATTFAVNVGVNKVSLMLMPMQIFFAFLAATGTSTILNFIGQKLWVFKKQI